MSNPVRIITQQESWRTEVQADVVDRLRLLLSKAEAGEIQGFVFIGLSIDDCIITAATKNNDQAKLIGGMERVKHRMLAAEG